MAKEPPLDPPDYDEPEPSGDEWIEWRLGDLDYLVEDDSVIEAVDVVLRAVGEAIKNSKDNKEDFAKGVGLSVIDAVEQYIKDGDLSDFVADMKQKAAEDFDEPDEPDDDCPQFYDGTGKY